MIKQDIVFVEGKPRPQGRPRGTILQGHIHIYQPKTSMLWQKTIMTAVEDKLNITAAHTGPVAVEMVFTNAHHAADIDNLIKPVLDALQKAGVYRNDSQVVHLVADKHSDKKATAGVLITIMLLDVNTTK